MEKLICITKKDFEDLKSAEERLKKLLKEKAENEVSNVSEKDRLCELRNAKSFGDMFFDRAFMVHIQPGVEGYIIYDNEKEIYNIVVYKGDKMFGLVEQDLKEGKVLDVIEALKRIPL